MMNKCKVCGKELPDGILVCTECRKDHCKTCTEKHDRCYRTCEKNLRRMQAQDIINSEAKELKRKQHDFEDTRFTCLNAIKRGKR